MENKEVIKSRTIELFSIQKYSPFCVLFMLERVRSA